MISSARLETERLVLREMAPADVEALHEILGDLETLGWIRWNMRNYDQYGFGLWTLVLKETGEVAGDCGLTMQPVGHEQHVEVGYHLRKTLWRRGLASEAATACRDHAFGEVGVNRLIALVREENEPSAGVARRIGMRPWKRVERAGFAHVVWAMTREAWREAVSS